MTDIYTEDNVAGMVKQLSRQLEYFVECPRAPDGFFKIGLSGGSMVNIVVESLLNIKTDWSKWRFFFCDERLVPFDNKESIFGQYKTKLIGKIPVTEDQFIVVNPDLSAAEAANDYIKKMSVYFPPDSLPCFDLLLLGIGPDGHTCSLFPGHRLLDETSLWVGSLDDSPKPPPSRITFTLPVINNAKECCFIASGLDKAEILKKIFVEKADVPARRVHLVKGPKVRWIIDKEASSKITSD